MTHEVIAKPSVTEAQARKMTEDVRADVRALWRSVLDLYEAGVHLALGYVSWNQYWAGEFGQSGSRGDQLVRAGRVVRALERAGVKDLPRNDWTAGQLVPVYRVAPEDLPDVWGRAVELGDGHPTREHISKVVDPYKLRRHTPGDRAGAAKAKRRRRLAGVPILNAHVAATEAAANIDNALDSGMSDEMLGEWAEHVDEALRLLDEVAAKIRAQISS